MKLFKKILIAAGAIVIIVLAADVSAVMWFAHYRPPVEHADAVIVLGAAINTPALYQRTLEGLRFYQEGKADTMILSGGKIADADISEAQYMARVVSVNADANVNYIIEDQSHNTYENINNSKAKLRDADSVIIVSDEFHLARAFLLAKRAGYETVYWSAPAPSYYPKQQLRYYYFREFVAILAYIPRFITG